jgi:nickel-dependent lactate racemase
VHVSVAIAGERSLELEIPTHVQVIDALHAHDLPTENWQPAFHTQLRAPLGYPALSATVVEGDRIAITVDPELPEAAAVLSHLLNEIENAHVSLGQLCIVAMQEHATALRAACEQLEQGQAFANIDWVEHDPADETELAYLATTRDGRPIYLNRALCEADVVIPVGLARAEHSLADCGVHGAWFPTFSGSESHQRFSAVGNLQWETHHRRRREEAEEAAWLLGVNFVVQALPASGSNVAQCLCGEAHAVEQAARDFFRQHWLHVLNQEPAAALLVIDGPAAQHSWRNVAQALHTAASIVPEQGTIILATELATAPGPALASLEALELSEHQHELALLKIRSTDALAAKVIHDVLQTHRIFLRSQLDDAVVENLGLGAWHTPEQLQRLIQEHASCLVVGSAQHALFQLPA